MAKDKLTEYSSTAASNTDIGGVSLAEGGMQVSDINNAFREQMSHLKDFADGTTGVDVLNLQDDDASASIKLQAPATVTTTTTFTLPDGDGTDGQALKTDGSGALSFGTFLTSVAADSIGATEINVAGNGTSGQALLSDGDGSFSFGSVTNQAFQGTTGTNVASGLIERTSVNITPSSTSSKILILASMYDSQNNSSVEIELQRDSTVLIGSLRRSNFREIRGDGTSLSALDSMSTFWLDEPSTTSQINYKLMSDVTCDNANIIAIEL
jgi:hypothetical protein